MAAGTPDSLGAFCDAWLAAWTGNRPQALLDFYTDDAYYRDPAKPGGLRGREALGAYFAKLLAANPAWEWRAAEIMPTAAGFTLKWRARIPAGGQVVEEEGLDIVELREGRIARNEVYFDRAALLAAAAAPPAKSARAEFRDPPAPVRASLLPVAESL